MQTILVNKQFSLKINQQIIGLINVTIQSQISDIIIQIEQLLYQQFKESEQLFQILQSLTIKSERSSVNLLQNLHLLISKFSSSLEICFDDDIIQLRPINHKGDAGRPLLVVGSERYHGAAVLAIRGALYGGADYVYAVVQSKKLDAVCAVIPEAIINDELENIQSCKLADALAVGCGLDRTERSKAAFQAVWSCQAGRPLVVDADGLFFYQQVWSEQRPNVILTPNHREFGNLYLKVFGRNPHQYIGFFDDNTHSLQEAEACVAELAREVKCTILVKNALDIAANSNQSVVINVLGSRKRCAGQGDILVGVLVALLSRGCFSDLECCRLAAEIVREAARSAESEKGVAMVAGDVLEAVPKVMRRRFQYVQVE